MINVICVVRRPLPIQSAPQHSRRSIGANVERIAYSSIYVFKRPSLSVGRDFIVGILNMGGSGEGEGGGTGNNVAAPWLSCVICDVFVL
jgi:hypothetical protein